MIKSEINLFNLSVEKYLKGDFDPLFFLKAKTEIDDKFKKKYSTFYGLNRARLPSAWKEKYFEILEVYKVEDEKNPYEKILKELYTIKGLLSNNSFQASFVTKLVSFKDESYPIFDRNVSAYFGIAIPQVKDINLRICRFTKNMMSLKSEYNEIAKTKEFERCRTRLIEKDPRINTLHNNRIIDVIVWTIGKYHLSLI